MTSPSCPDSAAAPGGRVHGIDGAGSLDRPNFKERGLLACTAPRRKQAPRRLRRGTIDVTAPLPGPQGRGRREGKGYNRGGREGESERSPSLHAPAQRACPQVAQLDQRERRPGARDLVGSITGDDDLLVARNSLRPARQLAGRDRMRARDRLFPARHLAPQVDHQWRVAGTESGAQRPGRPKKSSVRRTQESGSSEMRQISRSTAVPRRRPASYQTRWPSAEAAIEMATTLANDSWPSLARAPAARSKGVIGTGA